MVREYFRQFANSHHARTFNAHDHTFQRMFKWLDMRELMNGIELRKAISTPAKYFQSHQIAQIKKQLLQTDHELWLTCQFIYYCLIRPGE